MRHLRLPSALASVALAGIFLLEVAAGPATAATLPGGSVHLMNYGDGAGAGGNVVLTGAIADSGASVSIDSNGTVDPSNNTEVNLALVHGSFRINIQALNKKINKAFNSFQPNSSTCSGYITASGPVTVVSGSGTGAYTNISGSFNLNFVYALIGPKITSGKHKGQCDQSNNAPTLGSAQIVTGSGRVSF